MIKTSIVRQFARVISSLDGGAGSANPSMMVNFRCAGSNLRFRYGYAAIGIKPGDPGDTFECLGFDFVRSASGQNEFISVENRDGTIGAFSVNSESLARGLTPLGGLELADGKWKTVGFYDSAYLINPGGAATVYRHTIGSSNLTVLEDQGYTAPVADPEIEITSTAIGSVAFDATNDTFALTVDNTITSPTVAQSGSGFTVSGAANDNGPQSPMGVTVEVEFDVAKNFSGSDYVALQLTKGAQFDDIKNDATTPQLKIGGSWVNVSDFKEFRNDNSSELTLALYVKPMSTLTSVEGIRFRVTTTHVAHRDSGVRVAFTVQPIQLGGVHLQASASGDRIWDSDAGGDGIKYGVRFRDAVGTNLSAVFEATIDSDQALGYYASSFSCPLGAKLLVSTTAAPGSPYDRAEILRLNDDGTLWKVLGTATASPYTKPDPYCEYELSGLTTATGTSGGTLPVPAPTFRTDGIVYAFPFKQFMVWLVNAGTANIQLSRVGNAEELYSDEATYDADDLTQPGQRTLSDGADDVPVWGTQAGAIAVIVGTKAAYSLAGDFPVRLSPSRQVPGSRGIVGMYAGTRFRLDGGGYAATYCDEDFNIWLIGNVPQFEGDATARPMELSAAVRGKLKEFLFSEQRIENPSLDKTLVNLEFQEETSSLWVILGNRAAVYRQDFAGAGWEFYRYALTTEPGEDEQQTCTDPSGNGGLAESVAPGDAEWTDVGFPFSSDDAYALCGPIPYGTGQKSEVLRVTGLTPSVLLPASATIDEVRILVETSKTGDLGVTETMVQPTFGDDLAVPRVISSTEDTEMFTLTENPTVAELNAGELGVDLQYEQEEWLEEWNDPDNWSVIATGSTSPDMTVEVEYTGPGSPPTKAYVDISSLARAYIAYDLAALPFWVTADARADNGLGVSLEGALREEETIGLPHIRYIPYSSTGSAQLIAESTKRTIIPLVAGEGTLVIHRSASGEITGTSDPYMLGERVDSSFTGSAVLAVPTQATVRVDSVLFSVCSTVTQAFGAPDWVGWSHACFTPQNQLLAVRTTGEIDAIERDYRNGSFVAGTSRDGGYQPPAATIDTQDITFEGVSGWVMGAQLHTLGTEPFSAFASSADGDYRAGFSTGIASSRWVRFPRSTSLRHSVRFQMEETDGGIGGFVIQLNQTSRAKTR